MAYASNKEFVERSGLGLRVVDENVGTGDNSETDFDLDNTNIISGTYTLSHAASGSNTFTQLTETTHYTLDKESGKVVLTAGGVTEVGTDIIYATYWYTDSFSDSVITDLISASDSEIDLVTGRKWSGSNSQIDYYNGKRNPFQSGNYPTTDEPFMEDYDRPDFMVLDKKPILNIDAVYYLNPPQAVAKFFNYDNGTATYTDKTSSVNSITEAPFVLFDDSPATSDVIYIGSSHYFLGLDVVLSTLGTGSPAIDWEYYNGSSWVDINETETDSGSSTFEASGKFTWTFPYGWTKTSINSYTAYWIRGTLTTGYTIDPQIASLTLNDSVSDVFNPRDYSFEGYGRLNFLNKNINCGTRNIRVDYKYGYATTPSYITELSILLASIRAYIGLSGGSYDDATSYSLGSKSVSIGEVYVNIREVIDQFKKRADELFKQIGKRGYIASI